ncbi:MAG: sigma-70 family RNA polymerase sigma factor [Phycisphaerae bacterium]|nr:sigma-70 family RNA polymerase sigma factor [Phycisphaerae bacterium]
MTHKEQLARAGLTDRQTECLALYYFDDYTQDEIAERLGITQPTVVQHLQYGLAKLEHVGLKFREPQAPGEPPRFEQLTPVELDNLDPRRIAAVW